jgi:hypothetical protein
VIKLKRRKHMKFITMSTFKDAYYVLPEADRNQLGAASIQWVVDLKSKMGDKFRLFESAGDPRAISLSEFDTYEEYARSLNSPAYVKGLLNYMSLPVIEYNEQELRQYADMFKAAK